MSDINLFYASYGTGDPVFFVHGGPGLDSVYLEKPFFPLSDEFHIIFHDQRCLGRSTGTPTPDTVSLELLVGDIDRVCAGLNLDKVHLVGHSWGALLATHTAYRHPERIASLTLISPISPDFYTAMLQRAHLLDSMSIDTRDALVTLATSEPFLLGEASAVQSYLDLWYKHTMAMQPSHETYPLYPNKLTCKQWSRVHTLLFQRQKELELPADLASLTLPTLIIQGAADPCSALSPYDKLPSAQIEHIPNCGHFPFLEAPQQFFPLLQSFLKETTQPS